MKIKLLKEITIIISVFVLTILANTPIFSQCITSKGGAIINEFSNGPIKNQEFIEILVIGNETGENVNLQGYIIDDNNDPQPGVGNEPGHIRLGPCFSSLSPGQLILIYNDKEPYPGIELLEDSPNLMLVPFNDPCIIKMEGCPNHTTDSYDCGYQVYDPNANWVAYIAAHNYGDKIQLINNEKEILHSFEWGLPTPSVIHSTQRKSYIHTSGYSYSWKPESESTPGTPNNFANYLFIQNMESGNFYENLDASYAIECTSINVDITGGFANYTYWLKKIGSTIQYTGISSTGLLSFNNLDCGDYKLTIVDNLSCTVELEIAISGQGECFVEEPPNQLNYGIGDQCLPCKNGNNCFEWESSLDNTFGLSIPTGKNIVLLYEKGIELKNANGYLIRKEYDLNKAKVLSETKYWFNEDDLEGLCSDSSPESCSGIDTDGDGICDSEDPCPDSQDNEDSDGDGICDIYDCAPNNAEESLDSDGDGVCDGLDCAPDNENFYTDTDGDGVCDNDDCQPQNPNIYQGASCNDNSDCTKNDTFNSNCECIGEIIPNCSEDCSGGEQCDDNNPCTRDDKFDSNCNCIGTIILDCEECEKGSACDDNNDCTYDDVFDSNCNCKGLEIEECSEDCIPGTNCDDSNPCTLNDIYGTNCDCNGTSMIILTISKESYVDCFHEILLIASGATSDYRWYKNGSSLNEYTDRIIVSNPGKYTVKVHENELCEFSKSITIEDKLFDSNIKISQSEKSICNQDDPIELAIDPSFTESRWFLEGNLMPQHSGKNEILIYQEGEYSVEANNSLNCINKGATNIYTTSSGTGLALTPSELKITPENPNYCPGESIVLSINPQPSTSQILWSTGNFTSSITVSNPGTYSVTVTNQHGCISTDKVEYIAEDLIDIDKVLKSNNFVREKVKIHSVINTIKKGSNSTGRDPLSQEVNVDNVNIYEILRIEADSEPEPIDLIKFAQKRIDTHHHYDQEATGLLVDDFCPESSDGFSLSEFIDYSKTQGAFAYYIQKAEAGEETYLYYKQADFMAGIKGVNHDELFKEVFYSILCNRKNQKNTVLEKPSLYEVKKSSSNGIAPITFTGYESVDYIVSGSITLPDRDKATFWADKGIGTWNPFSSDRGILISNYRQNGVLLTSDESNYTYPLLKDEAVITAKREKIKADVRGKFWEIKIKYDPSSLSSLEGELGEETQPLNEEYLVISIPFHSYSSHPNNKDRMDGLLNYMDEYIDLALAENRTYPSPELLPACLFESEELCTLIKDKYKHITTFGGPLPVFNNILSDPINDLKDGFSNSVISCFEENKLVDNYYYLGEEHFGEDKVNLLGNLKYHYFKAYPSFNTEIEDEEKFVKLVQLDVSDKGENDDLEDDILSYNLKSINDDYFDYQSEWKRWSKVSNLYPIEETGYSDYLILTNTGVENKKINYFDSDISTEIREGYPVQLSKEYNFLLKEDTIPVYFDNQFKLVEVPGIYIAYAIERKKYNDAILVRDNLIDLAAIAFSFGELAPVVYAARLGRLRKALAQGEISTSIVNLFLRNSEWCQDVEPDFCNKWQRYTQAAQLALLAGQGSTFLYSKLRPVKKYYNSLPEGGTQRDAIDEAIEKTPNGISLADFHKLMDPHLDDLADLKVVFQEVDIKYTSLINQVFESVLPNQKKLFDLAEDIKELPLSGRKEFFEDLIKTANDPGKIGKELGSLDGGVVKAWKDLFDFPNLRKNAGALEAKTLPQGSRPNPEDYLDASYINSHLNDFYGESQASRIVLKDSYLQYGVGKPDAGKTEFVSRKSDIDDLINQANGDINVIANELGVPVEQLQGGLVRIDFNINSSGNKVFMPSGNEYGANPQWLPGGKLPDGKSEAIVKTEGMVEEVDYVVNDIIL